jgi:CcmD family protein
MNIFQTSDKAAKLLANNAKFNVVIAVLSIIFIGIVIYLVKLDRKVSKLEKNQKWNHYKLHWLL